MGFGGISALASLVDQGRLKRLKALYISKNEAVPQQGIITLARAIDKRGLPMLETLKMTKLGEMTARAIGAIAHAVFKGCPQLQAIELMGSGWDTDTSREVVEGIVEAAGRSGKVKVIYDEEDDDDDEEEDDDD